METSLALLDKFGDIIADPEKVTKTLQPTGPPAEAGDGVLFCGDVLHAGAGAGAVGDGEEAGAKVQRKMLFVAVEATNVATPFARENQLHAAYLLDHIKRSLCETNETTAEWAYWGTEGEGLLRDLTEKALKHQASLGHQWPIGAKRSWPKGARANKGDLPKLLCQVKEVARVQLAVQLAVSVGSNMPRPIRTNDWRKGGCFGEAAVELAYEFAGEGKGHNVWPGAASATHS